MLTLHPPAFIESSGCDGPRYIRGQPSRETPGTIMTDIQHKYITEFELPYRNVLRYTKEVRNSWDKLNQAQKNELKKSFKEMFQTRSDAIPDTNETLLACVEYVARNPEKNFKALMSELKNPTDANVATQQLRNVVQNATNDNNDPDTLHMAKWKTCLVGFLLLLVVFLIGYGIGQMPTNNVNRF